MFKISQVVSKLKAAGAIAALALLLVPHASAADNASYFWADSANTAITASGGPFQGTVSLTKQAQAGGVVAFSAQTQLDCGGQPTNVTVELDVAASDYQKTYPTPAQAFVTPPDGKTCDNSGVDKTVKIAQDAGSSTASPTAQDSQCDQGGASWLVCPLMQKISEAVSTIAQKVLTPLLAVKPISAQNTPGLYQAWSNIKHLSEVLFVFIFMAAIFSTATTMGLDQYTVKRILPRLIAAAVLIEFSFFISSFVIDLGNILGAGVQDLILANFQSGSMQPDQSILSNLAQISGLLAIGGVAAFASYVMALPVLVLLLISALAFLLTLAARYMIIAILVAVSPLAILAWVLPNTSRYFSKWWSSFIKLILMYPIILGILAVGRRVTEIFSFTDQATTNGFTNFLSDLLKPFIIIALFMAIPATFKWAGGLMATTHGAFQNVAGKGRKRVKEGQWYKDQSQRAAENRLRMVNRMAESKPITSLTHSNSRAKQAAGGFLTGMGALAIGSAPNTPLARQRAFSKHISDYNKELDDLAAGSNVDMLKTLIEASWGTSAERQAARARISANEPALLRYTESEAGRMAVIRKMADMKVLGKGDMKRILQHSPEEYGAALQAGGKAFSTKPGVFMRYAEGELDKNGVAHKAGELKLEAMKGVMKGWDARSMSNSDLQVDHFQLAAEEPEMAEAFSVVSSEAFEEGFRKGHRNQLQMPKRTELIKMLGVYGQRDFFTSGNGLHVKTEIMKKLNDNADALDGVIEFARKQGYDVPDAMKASWGVNPADFNTPDNWPDLAKSSFVEEWINR